MSPPRQLPRWLKELDAGANVWARRKGELFQCGTATGMEGDDKLTVAFKIEGESGTNDVVFNPLIDEVYPGDEQTVEDICNLNDINLPTILHCLKERSQLQDENPIRSECYTYLANILVSVNPLNIKLVDPEVDQFVDKNNMAPHPFGLAEAAFKQMVSTASEGFRDQVRIRSPTADLRARARTADPAALTADACC